LPHRNFDAGSFAEFGQALGRVKVHDLRVVADVDSGDGVKTCARQLVDIGAFDRGRRGAFRR
jgi:hypothetical protein